MSLKHFHLTVLLLLFFQTGYAQKNTADSLLREIEASGKDYVKQAEMYCRLSFYELGNDVDLAVIYGRKAVNLGKEHSNDSILAKAYICLSYANENAGNIDEGLLTADSSLLFSVKSGKYRLRYHSENMLAQLNRRKAKYADALVHYMNALKIAENNNDEALMAKAYTGMGVLYVNQKDMKRAESYHLKALVIRKKLNDKSELTNSYNNLGIINRNLGNYKKALEYYFMALELAIGENDSADIAFLYNDIGAAYSKSNDVTNGKKYLELSIGIRERINEKNELAYTYNYLGENYERAKDLTLAEQYIKKALSTAKEIGNNKQTYEAYESLSDFYSRNMKYDSAYYYAMRYKAFRDSVVSVDNVKAIAKLTTEFETEKKEHIIRQQLYEIKNRNYFIIGITILLFLAILLAFSAYRRYKLKQEARLQKEILKQQEMSTKAVIEAEENERKRIAGDLHDGVGQMMSAAKINLSSIIDEIPFANKQQKSAFDKAIDLVDESCKEVRAVSHNIMPNSLLKKSLASAIREFINKIDTKTLKINLYTEGLNEKIDESIEIVLYRVIQECVNNVIKHSGANHMDISVIKDNDGISATIEDNGRGFNAKDVSKFTGLGLRNIQTRIGYLKGTVEWDSMPGKGTLVAIHVPVN